MDMIYCNDGTTECVRTYEDIVDIVRDKIGNDLADLLLYDYNYSETYKGCIDLLNRVCADGGEYDKVEQSNDIDEIKKEFIDLVCDIEMLV